MTLAENIYHHSRNLPEQAAREALDFVEFLEQRYARNPSLSPSPGDTGTFIAAVAGSTKRPESTWEQRVLKHAGVLGDDFPSDIDDSDLGVDAPRDSLE